MRPTSSGMLFCTEQGMSCPSSTQSLAVHLLRDLDPPAIAMITITTTHDEQGHEELCRYSYTNIISFHIIYLHLVALYAISKCFEKQEIVPSYWCRWSYVTNYNAGVERRRNIVQHTHQIHLSQYTNIIGLA